MSTIGPSCDPHRLGVHLHGDGADVAVLASHADRVELCLLDPAPEGGWSERRVELGHRTLGVWHAHVPGIRAGQHYGFRVHGRWDPAAGLRHNPAKFLLDPYARGVAGEVRLGPEIHPHRTDATGAPVGPGREPDEADSRDFVPHGVVLESHPPFVRRPAVPWDRTVIYEAHVVGLTKQLEAIPEELRGTYAGVAHPVTIEHLRSLGVTAIELLPIHAKATEPHLVRRGKENYWGYNTLSFFAPEPSYATEAARTAGPAAVLDEVKGMVSLLHDAGIEVLLDVVYNHTCEGGVDGPALSWRGLDATVYYLHDGSSPARLSDWTGTGNTLDFRRRRVVAMALDSLRYWATEVGVDGFRFDLAVSLGRDDGGFTSFHPFLVAAQADPVLRSLKLIAEPWDLGPGGWRTGAFPPGWAEWNDRFRDAVRTFWLVDPGQAAHGRVGHGVRELATRLAGSADVFGHSDPPLMRGPQASINYVTAHDGFTLADLAAYEHKLNHDNGEDNRDGTNDNRSWNHGLEGPVAFGGPGAAVLPLRRRSIRNLLAMLILSAGTPMITAGDEMGRTQQGNNNAYTQNNPVSWMRWDMSPWRSDLLATTRHLLRLRREHPALRATEFYFGRPPAGRADPADHRPDLDWRGAHGRPLSPGEWDDPAVRTVQMVRTAPDGCSVLLVVNGALDPVEVTLPDGPGTAWALAWDSAFEHPDDLTTADAASVDLAPRPGDSFTVEPLAIRVYVAA